MQGNNNSGIDARTFQQIWMSLGERSPKQLELRDELIAKLHVSRQTINNWGRGCNAPVYDEVKKKVADIVSRTLGFRVSFRTLFA